jgi:hypothetical protein
MAFPNPFRGRKGGNTQTPPAPSQPPPKQQPDPSTGPLPGGPTVNTVKNGSVSLITFAPEELLRQVEERRNSVSFDTSNTAKFMDNFSQIWSWAGPIIFALGTIGEIYLVLWQRQITQDWFTGSTIVAVSMIAEGTLLAISFTAKRLRNRADKRPSGWSDKEKRKLLTLKQFWFILAVGVAATQIAFIIAQTKTEGLGTAGVWAIAIIRSAVALVADAYTAFMSEEKPTSGEMAIEQQDKETEFTDKLLTQKAHEVEILNAGAIKVQEVGIEADMKQSRMHTQREIAQMQNDAQIESMRQDQEQKVMIDRMRNSAMRAVFDPLMDPGERQAIITMLTSLAGATNRPQPPSTTIVQEDEV